MTVTLIKNAATNSATVTPIENAAGVTNRSRISEAKAGSEVGMNAVQLAGQWKPPQDKALTAHHDTKTHMLPQAALLESAHMAAAHLLVNESLNARLAAYHRHVDKGWDPNEVIPEDVAAVPDKTTVTALVTALIPCSVAEANDKNPPTEGLAQSTRELPCQANPPPATAAQRKPSARNNTCATAAPRSPWKLSESDYQNLIYYSAPAGQLSKSDHQKFVSYPARADRREGNCKPENMDLTINFHTDGMPDKGRGNDITRGDINGWCNLKQHTYTSEALRRFMSVPA
jgi:hypothetical protein